MSTTIENVTRRTAKAAEEGMGKCGGEVLTTTGATAGNFVAVQCLADANLTTVGTPAMTTLAIKAGTIVFGRFSSVTSGTANAFIAYNSCG